MGKGLTKQDYRKLRFAADSHTGNAFIIAGGAVRAIITKPIIIINQLFRSWQPVVVSAIVTYKPYFHVPTSIAHFYLNVNLQVEPMT